MDRQYNDVWKKPGDRPPFETSLFVQTTVISANRAGLVTTDAGFKSFATDDGVPVIAHGAPPGADYFFFGDEQGGVIYSEETRKLRSRRCDRLRGSALRSDGQSLRPLSCRSRRHAGGDLAGGRARALRLIPAANRNCET